MLAFSFFQNKFYIYLLQIKNKIFIILNLENILHSITIGILQEIEFLVAKAFYY